MMACFQNILMILVQINSLYSSQLGEGAKDQDVHWKWPN
jgi:hypothetical protein